ncbi:acyltransferase family protein [Escherichia coli]|nr:acyltransferase [Escherichia coli]EFE3811393.1 acyltransferase [Escherichia coli]EJF6665654.1 acyltransferase [Escherichia coli]EJK1952126.1 acyltransferase [Escherichia coli]HCN8164507.1 acyltransferase [Escherichia coli]
MKSKNISYMPRVDHLRFYAVTLVILVHTYMAAGGGASNNIFMFPVIFGSTGVTLFLVLSGFLFTLISDCGKKEIKYGGFIYNRILRVFPLLILASFTSMAITRDTSTIIDFLSSFLFSNLSHTPMSKLFGPTWTIAVELQFYLIFPFLIVFVRNFGVKYLLGLIFFWLVWRALIVYSINPTGVAIDNGFYYLTIIGRMDQFLVGMIAAFAYSRYKEKLSSPILLIMSATCVLLMLYYLPIVGVWYTPRPFRSAIGVVEPICWALFVVSYLSVKFNSFSWLSYVASKLGELSYSAYITHGLVLFIFEYNKLWISFTEYSNINAVLNGALLVIPCVMVVSWLSFTFVEKPFLTLRKSYSGK